MTTETVTPEMRQRMREQLRDAAVVWFAGAMLQPYPRYMPSDILALLDALDQAEEQNDDMLDEIEWLWKQSGVDLNLEAAQRLGLILYRHDRLFAAEADDDE